MNIFGWGKDKGQQIKKANSVKTVAPKHKIDLSLIPLDDLLYEVRSRCKTIAMCYMKNGEDVAFVAEKTKDIPELLWMSTLLRLTAESKMIDGG